MRVPRGGLDLEERAPRAAGREARPVIRSTPSRVASAVSGPAGAPVRSSHTPGFPAAAAPIASVRTPVAHVDGLLRGRPEHRAGVVKDARVRLGKAQITGCDHMLQTPGESGVSQLQTLRRGLAVRDQADAHEVDENDARHRHPLPGEPGELGESGEPGRQGHGDGDQGAS